MQNLLTRHACLFEEKVFRSRLLPPRPCHPPSPAAPAPRLAPPRRNNTLKVLHCLLELYSENNLNNLLKLHLIRNVPQQLTVKKLFNITGHQVCWPWNQVFNDYVGIRKALKAVNQVLDGVDLPS